MAKVEITQSSHGAPALKGVFYRRLLMVTLLLVAIAVGLVFPFPLHGRFWGSIFDLAHAPTFFLALLVLTAFFDPARVGLSRRHPVLYPISLCHVCCLALFLGMIGLCGEFVQKFAGRSPSWHDVAANSAGLAAGCCWAVAFRMSGRTRQTWLVLAFVVIAVPSWRPVRGILDGVKQISRFPILSSFEDPSELRIWSSNRAKLVQTSEWSSDGDYSGLVSMTAGKSSGIWIGGLVGDWSNYTTLNFDVYNPGAHSVELIFRVYDLEHLSNGGPYKDRFEMDISVDGRDVRNVSIPLFDIKSAPESRQMQLQHMELVEIYAWELQRDQQFLLDNVRLEK